MEAGTLTGVSWEGFSHCKRQVLASLSPQTFLQKASSLVSSLVWSFQGSPPTPHPTPAHALLFLTSPAWLSSKAQQSLSRSPVPSSSSGYKHLQSGP